MRILLPLLTATLLLTHCSTTPSAPSAPKSDPSATSFLQSLWKQDRLPGIVDSLHHGELTETTSALSRGYPQTRSFEITQDHGTSLLHYKITRPTAEAIWTLTTASRHLPDGTPIQYYPL